MAEIIDMPGVKLFEGSEKERVTKFMQEVERLVQQFDCALVPEIKHIGTQTIPNIIAIAKPRLPEGQADPSMN